MPPRVPRVINSESGTLSINYRLSELTSASERAGLAGLILHVQHMSRLVNRRGVYQIRDLTELGVTLEVDQVGFSEAFADLFAMQVIEKRFSNPKRGVTVQPKRIEEEEPGTNAKEGAKPKRWFIYDESVPVGSILSELPIPWINLYRDFMYYLYSKPPQRSKWFSGCTNVLAIKEFDLLVKGSKVRLDSSAMLGAQDSNADGVAFHFEAKNLFLLRFWPLVAQLYRVQIIKDLHKTPKLSYRDNEKGGMVAAIPDVMRLKSFCECFEDLLRDRRGSCDPQGFLYDIPKGSIIQMNAESAIQFGIELDTSLSRLGRSPMAPVVSGFDVFHLKVKGQSISTTSKLRINPTPYQRDEYSKIRDAYWDVFFRRTLIQNLLDSKPWYFGFNRLFETLPKSNILGDTSYFQHDARKAFESRGVSYASSSKSDG